MAARKQGSIVHISSILAQLAVPGRSVYCATKGAVEALTRAMAVELIADNIRVNTVSPGMIRTEALEAGFSDPEHISQPGTLYPWRPDWANDGVGAGRSVFGVRRCQLYQWDCPAGRQRHERPRGRATAKRGSLKQEKKVCSVLIANR